LNIFIFASGTCGAYILFSRTCAQKNLRKSLKIPLRKKQELAVCCTVVARAPPSGPSQNYYICGKKQEDRNPYSIQLNTEALQQGCRNIHAMDGIN
jgi:hypothetical protein